MKVQAILELICLSGCLSWFKAKKAGPFLIKFGAQIDQTLDKIQDNYHLS